MTPPFEGTPRALRGDTITVRFFVNSRGAVDRVEMIPMIEDLRYRRMIEDIMLGYRFKPARDSIGRLVNGIAYVQLTLPNH